MQKLVVLTGAGISAESGLKTFRDSNGLWENHKVEEVATPEAWERNPTLVLNFYNQRRSQLANANPNAAHRGLVDLAAKYDVHIITQNVDNLHEQAGSKKVLHLHGELTKVRSTGDPSLIYDIGHKPVKIGDKCEKGFQLRPHIVWFGEMVPAIAEATEIATMADVFVIIGTSLNVYPAAGLVQYVSRHVPVYLIDPGEAQIPQGRNVQWFKENATTGVARLIELLKE